jgi:hypothetical protein
MQVVPVKESSTIDFQVQIGIDILIFILFLARLLRIYPIITNY